MMRHVECRYKLNDYTGFFFASCPVLTDKEPHYRFPFEDHVCGDPSLDDMFRVVCSEEHRPAIPQHWDDFEVCLLSVLFRCKNALTLSRSRRKSS